jgi:hypothetical protein
MNDGAVDNLMPSTSQDKHAYQGQFDRGPVAPHLELTIEGASQAGRRCRPCATVGGRYYCQPTAAAGREWRHTESGMDLVVSLIQRKPETDPRLRVLILIEHEGLVHASAVYVSEPLSNRLLAGPWALKLISEESECGFEFPGQVRIVASGKLTRPRERVSFGSCR